MDQKGRLGVEWRRSLSTVTVGGLSEKRLFPTKRFTELPQPRKHGKSYGTFIDIVVKLAENSKYGMASSEEDLPEPELTYGLPNSVT